MPPEEGARSGPSIEVPAGVPTRGRRARALVWPIRRRGGATLGLSDSTLWNWVRADREAKARAEDTDALSESELVELKRLRKEVAPRRIDMEILCKAAAYFAREMMR